MSISEIFCLHIVVLVKLNVKAPNREYFLKKKYTELLVTPTDNHEQLIKERIQLSKVISK